MTSPYIPPTIDVFYEQPASCDEAKEMCVIDQEARPFMFHEAFYCEPPMAQVNEYSCEGHMYEAKEFDSHWSSFGKDSQESDCETDCDNIHCVVDLGTEPHSHSSGGKHCSETHNDSSGGDNEHETPLISGGDSEKHDQNHENTHNSSTDSEEAFQNFDYTNEYDLVSKLWWVFDKFAITYWCCTFLLMYAATIV